MDKSWQEPDEILILFTLDEHEHGSIYAEGFHFLRDFTVIDTVSQKPLSEQGYPFSLKPARVLRQPVKLFDPTPRIHGELQKLGIEISERTISRLLRDRDQIYGEEFRLRVAGMKIEEVITAARSPWQNACVQFNHRSRFCATKSSSFRRR